MDSTGLRRWNCGSRFLSGHFQLQQLGMRPVSHGHMGFPELEVKVAACESGWGQVQHVGVLTVTILHTTGFYLLPLCILFPRLVWGILGGVVLLELVEGKPAAWVPPASKFTGRARFAVLIFLNFKVDCPSCLKSFVCGFEHDVGPLLQHRHQLRHFCKKGN